MCYKSMDYVDPFLAIHVTKGKAMKEKISKPELQRFYYNREKIFRVRLVIALPVVMAFLVAAPNILTRGLLKIFLSHPEGITQENVSFLLNLMNILIFSSICLTGIFSIIFTNHLMAPIRKLSDHLLQLAEKGHIERVNFRTGDEIALLGESYNRMVMSMSRYLPERARFIFHNLASGVLTFNVENGIIDTINSAADKMLEMEGVGVVGRNFFDVFGKFPGLDPLTLLFEKVIKTGDPIIEEEVEVRTCKGNILSIMVSTTLVNEPGEKKEVIIATIINLSRLKEISNQLILEEKLSAVGSLAAGVAHEIRNPLASLKGMTQLLSEKMDQSDTHQRYIGIILSEVDRLNGVVENLLDFARPDKDQYVNCNLKEIIQDAVRLVSHQLKKKKITLQSNIPDDLPIIPLKEKRIVQLFLNILLNAIEAMPEDHEIFINVFYRDQTRKVQVAITNTGSEIPEKIRGQIFNPFFTTKKSGTGLGLAVCQQIMNQHRGTIALESEPQKTTFILTFPMEQRDSDSVNKAMNFLPIGDRE